MNNEQMLAAVLALPGADLMTASKIDDPIGAGNYYRADTVVRLLAAERERCAKLCEEVHADTSECPELALHCAARIRGAQRPSSGARRRRVACSAVPGSTDHCLMTTKGTDVYNLKTTPGPWRWWTSCSFRRLSSEATGRDGDVLHAATQHSDGHPDVQLMNGGHDGPDGRAIAAVPDMLKVLQMIDAHYSGSLDHQPGYVKAARQVLGGICAAQRLNSPDRPGAGAVTNADPPRLAGPGAVMG